MIRSTIATERTSSLIGHETVPAALSAGFDRAFLVGAGFSAAGALVAAVVLSRVRRRATAPAAAQA